MVHQSFSSHGSERLLSSPEDVADLHERHLDACDVIKKRVKRRLRLWFAKCEKVVVATMLFALGQETLHG